MWFGVLLDKSSERIPTLTYQFLQSQAIGEDF